MLQFTDPAATCFISLRCIQFPVLKLYPLRISPAPLNKVCKYLCMLFTNSAERFRMPLHAQDPSIFAFHRLNNSIRRGRCNPESISDLPNSLMMVAVHIHLCFSNNVAQITILHYGDAVRHFTARSRVLIMAYLICSLGRNILIQLSS